jgi:NAD(P)-dependent dehydrogenase (short-subunit alcohol dehydrogenase family)
MDRVLVVTGAGRGIGAATALLAARRGYRVCVNYRSDAAAAAATVAQIRAAGGTAVAVAADISIEAEVERLFDTAAGELGPLAALVNNAGILLQQSPLLHMNAERLHKVFATNVIGSMLCAREAVRRMSASGGGAIVNVSSRAAQLGGPNEYVDYAASKGAIDTFTMGLAREVAAVGIRVNAVRPGLIHTDMHASGGEPGRIARLQGGVPMQRGGTPEEVAEAILWLLSDAAAYVTGAFIDVSGGR